MVLSLNGLDATNFVALGETTLTKEAHTLVSDNFAGLIVVLRTQRLDFLLNDLFLHKKINVSSV